MVDFENLHLEKTYFKWNRLSLHAMHSDISQEEKARSDAEAETAYAKSGELQKIITSENKELVGFILKEGILSVFSANE